MPLDPALSLQVKPPVIESPDLSKTFLTLGQLRYLNAETAKAQVGAQAAQEEAARKQLGFAEDAAANRYLSDLGKPRPVTGATGGPPYDAATLGALPQGGSTPAPGPPAGPAPGTVNLLDPEVQAAIRQVAPHTADAKITALQAHATTTLNLQKEALAQTSTKIGLVSNFLGGATDQQSLDMGRAFLHQSGIDTAAIPTTWTPDLPQKIGEWSRTAQQRVEQGNKVIEQRRQQQEADTAAFQAETARRGEERPYPMGMGYGRDPRGPAPLVVGPQGGATEAPRSAEAQGYINTLSSEFESASKGFAESTAAFNQTVPLLKDKTNTSDLMSLRGFQKLSEPGQAIGVFGGKQTEALGNIMEQITGEITRLTTDKGATIAEPLRLKMAETAKKLHAIHIDQHLQIRDDIRAKATRQLGPGAALEVAPNRLTTYGSGHRDKVLTQAQFQEILTHERAQGKTRGEVYLDLTDNGYSVRGGPP